MLALLLTVLAEPQLRTLDSLPGLPYRPYSFATTVNDAGDAAGAVQGPHNELVPVIWSAGLLHELPVLYGDFGGSVYSLNNFGSACGQSIGPGTVSAVLWSGGVVTDLGSLGVPSAAAIALNDAGIVVGNAYPLASQYTHAFRWDPSTGVMSDLGTLGGPYSAASSVDAAGNAYGVANDAANVQYAVMWPAGGGAAVRLDSFGKLDFSSIARGCSPGGIVVGDGYDIALGQRGFVWSATGGFQLLPQPPGTTIQRAQCVNDAGLAMVYGADLRLWIHDLQTGGWSVPETELPPYPRTALSAGYAINASGQIAGHGFDFVTGATQMAWLLSPAPDGFGLGEAFPAKAGATNALGAAGMTPGAVMHLVGGFQLGSTAVPGCGGSSVGIHQPVHLATRIADAQGVVEWSGVLLPQVLAGRRFLLQAIERPSCRLSNLSSVDFR